jgi:hypothetical protein
MRRLVWQETNQLDSADDDIFWQVVAFENNINPVADFHNKFLCVIYQTQRGLILLQIWQVANFVVFDAVPDTNDGGNEGSAAEEKFAIFVVDTDDCGPFDLVATASEQLIERSDIAFVSSENFFVFE